uniref:Metaxin glutathione S-transferase domain-containing protein n=1 Tax=Timema cristinae TaxID=61476 RepID=A0A7R9C8T6_TIMCR|nr:unnamed protein product [Timema cristinae]
MQMRHKNSKSLDKNRSQSLTKLSQRKANHPFITNLHPTELDALVFGHVFTILTTPLPNNQFAGIVRGYDNLIELCKRVEKDYFEKVPEH